MWLSRRRVPGASNGMLCVRWRAWLCALRRALSWHRVPSVRSRTRACVAFAGFTRVSCVMHLVRMFVMAPCAERV